MPKETSTNFENKQLLTACPVTYTIILIGGRWKPIILWSLVPGTRCFSELRRDIGLITEKMLTQQLRELERDGLVQRQVYQEVPQKVEYSLTREGQSLQPVLEACCGGGWTICPRSRFWCRRWAPPLELSCFSGPNKEGGRERKNEEGQRPANFYHFPAECFSLALSESVYSNAHLLTILFPHQSASAVLCWPCTFRSCNRCCRWSPFRSRIGSSCWG